MSVKTAIEDGALTAVLDSIRQTVRAERKRTELEREVFQEFASRVAAIQPSGTPSAGKRNHGDLRDTDTAVPSQSAPVSGPHATDTLATVRRAYEETVMSLPFYESEYGDPYEVSIRKEFGPDVATALTEANALNPIAKQALVTQVEEAWSKRDVLLETFNREHESINGAAAILLPIADELRTFQTTSFENHEFGTLEARRTRLLTLEEKCERAATDRQATIHHHQTEYNTPAGTPDICAYLYREFESTYPILYLCSDFAKKINEYRQCIESEISTRTS